MSPNDGNLARQREHQLSLLLEEPPSDFLVEKALSNELMNLSLQERVAIEEEIHGVRCGRSGVDEENEEFLDQKLQEFDALFFAKKQEQQSQEPGNTQLLLRNVVRTHGATVQSKDHKNHWSYDTTKGTYQYRDSNGNDFYKGCYLNDLNVRLRFLRCDSFQVPKSVNRLVLFLEFTHELFGDAVADRPIRLSDLSTQELIAFRNSRNQFLPFRDRSGRKVMMGVGCCNFHLPLKMRFRMMMLLIWKGAQDVETQRKGVVTMAWLFDEEQEDEIEAAANSDGSPSTSSGSRGGKPKPSSRPKPKANWKILRPGFKKQAADYHHKYNLSMPMRVVSVQQFYKDTAFFRALATLYVFYGINKEKRSMYRVHFGEQIELRYKISNLGIPESVIPMTTTGKVKTDYQSSWVSMVRAMEEQEQKRRLFAENPLLVECNPQHFDEIVQCPLSMDVVFRKGRPLYMRNPGNMNYRELIAATNDEHWAANRQAKYEITWKIVQQIEAREGRFLEWTPLDKGSGGMWIVIKDRKAIRDKVASAFKQYNRDYHNSATSNTNNRKKKKKETTTNTQVAAGETTRLPETKSKTTEPQHRAVTPTSVSAGSSSTDTPARSDKSRRKSFRQMSNDLSAAIADASAVVSGISLESDPSRPYLFLQAEHRAYDFVMGSSSKRMKLSSDCGGFGTLCLGNEPTPSGGFHPDFNKDSSCFFGKPFFPTGS